MGVKRFLPVDKSELASVVLKSYIFDDDDEFGGADDASFANEDRALNNLAKKEAAAAAVADAEAQSMAADTATTSEGNETPAEEGEGLEGSSTSSNATTTNTISKKQPKTLSRIHILRQRLKQAESNTPASHLQAAKEARAALSKNVKQKR